MPPQNGLFINSRYKLVTYSQCGNLDEWSVVERFTQLGAECIVGRELHADGGTHLHVFADFGRKFRSRDARILDVGDRHPNVVASWGTPEEGYDYAIKDGDVVAGGLARPESSRGSNGADANRWARIADAGDREEFFALVRELDPKTFVTRIKDLEYFADRHYRSIPAPYESPVGISFIDDGTDGRSEWVLQSGIGMGEPYIGKSFPMGGAGEKRPGGVRNALRSPYRASSAQHKALVLTFLGRRKSLCVYGASRLGKTLWARSLGRHVYFCGLFSGKELINNLDVDYAIFDDMQGGIGFFHGWKNWFGCQLNFQVKQMYRDPVNVTWGKTCIWLSNDDPRDSMKNSDIEWINENCIFVEVTAPIFHANTQ